MRSAPSPRTRLLVAVALALIGAGCLLASPPDPMDVGSPRDEGDADVWDVDDGFNLPDGAECVEPGRMDCVADTSERTICSDGYTVEPTLSCGEDETCRDGRCYPISGRFGQDCEEHTACSGTEVCLFGHCGERAGLGPGQHCVKPRECAPGLVCNGTCQREHGSCETGEDCPLGASHCISGLCSTGANDSPCHENDDCEPEHRCIHTSVEDVLGERIGRSVCSDGLQSAPCTRQVDCLAGGCFFSSCHIGESADPCREDLDCSATADGACVRAWDCLHTEPDEGEYGSCRAQGAGQCCGPETGCGPGLVCADGTCQ